MMLRFSRFSILVLVCSAVVGFYSHVVMAKSAKAQAAKAPAPAVAAAPAVQTVSYKADIFEMGSGRKNKVATMKVELTPDGEKTNTLAQYLDNEGKVVFEDKAVLNGLQIVKDEISQKQTGASATVEFDGKTAKFTKTEDGKTKTETETVKGDFVMSANFQKYVASKWADLMAGKTIEYRYGVWDRMETVGFSLRKIGETGDGADKRVTLLKKPSSFIIAALVNPIEFVVQGDGSRLLEMKGRIPVKKKDGSKWKDQDADVVYNH